jgi:hypothetical protein
LKVPAHLAKEKPRPCERSVISHRFQFRNRRGSEVCRLGNDRHVLSRADARELDGRTELEAAITVRARVAKSVLEDVLGLV